MKNELLFAVLTLSAGLWAKGVSYIDADGQEKMASVSWIDNSSTTLTAGWYAVKGEVQTGTLVCEGEVHLILVDGAKLTAMGKGDPICTPGIQVSGEGNSLTIYGQAAQTGQLIAKGGKWAAGIGGGKSAEGHNITINGGAVTAIGYTSAGIGGGYGGDGFNITINGGIVNTIGGQHGSGIGGGDRGNGSNITINGGTVTATGGDYASGIGGGDRGTGSNITIHGGTVKANAGASNAIAIGNGYQATTVASDIYISDVYVLKAGATANPKDVIAHTSTQDMASILTQRYVKIDGLATPYERSVTIGQWATMCLPYTATSFSGANFYKINYCDGNDKLYIEEVETLEAGMPYIFEATAETITINHAGVAMLIHGEEQTERGLYGSFVRTIIESDGNKAAISGGSVIIAEEDAHIIVPACRAYLDMNEVPTTEQYHKAPLRAMGIPRQTPTDIDNVNDNSKFLIQNSKLIMNGQLVIVRDGKMYNALGL